MSKGCFRWVVAGINTDVFLMVSFHDNLFLLLFFVFVCLFFFTFWNQVGLIGPQVIPQKPLRPYSHISIQDNVCCRREFYRLKML